MPECLPLPAIPAGYEGAYVATYSVVSITPKCETAGAAFYERVERHRYSQVKRCDSSSSSATSSDEQHRSSPEKAGEEGKKKNWKDNSCIAQRVRQVLETNQDLYALVCLPKSATCEDVKRQWRKLAMIFHPDKSAGVGKATHDIEGLPDVSKMTPEELHEQFLLRHNAFEILVDPVTKKQYDSYSEFDDRLPTDHEISTASSEGLDAFLKLCRPAFEKESRWCVKQPVPDIGDSETPIEKVKEFYKYWATYESWRDFANAGEFNLEEAQDREERKWMQKENWKVVKAMLKAERQRVLRFVSTAESKDPRIIAAKLAARAKTGAKSAASPKVNAAKAKANKLAEIKAGILAKRKKLAEGRNGVREVVKEWIDEKIETPDEPFQTRLQKFLANDQNADRISDLVQKLNNVTKRYKEPTVECANELKAVINDVVQSV